MKKAIKSVIIMIVIMVVMLEALIMYTASRDYVKQDYDYLIILGAKVNGENPSLALKYRLDEALEYLKNDDDIVVVVTGGQGADEAFAESLIMKKYLMAHNIAENRIIEENKSTSTYENLANSYQMTGEGKVLVATNDFHMFRSLLLAKKVGYTAQPLNATTPAIIKPKMYIREIPAFFLSYFLNL